VCRDLEEFGIVLDPELNRAAKGEARVSAANSRVQVWVMPTNEELIVARLAAQLLEG
jgi:acetate kinase